ncbi:hypothetical protein FGE12_07475 [Aggregicoccus sp. 17bor-14]|uniref:hypothetical protein n=1 Tax=Myxococcaceae TaxID=31 RepID=UPI00129CD47F|nr:MULTISPECIES: hypothetical protein [Myxococcaceae]MBF5042233.1 hypothetical protein [Simulacricoccus sp. 17bor-14]MRI88009.1 hypothetical protein [Aggregicoccus sp. 17bor-14]
MSDYHVPKRRLPVQLTLVGGSRVHVQLFLSARASGHGGEERLEDLLNGPHDFLPAQEVGSGETLLINRAALVVARVTHGEVTDPPEEVGAGAEHAVQVHLLDGSVLAGRICYARPESSARLSDFLNEPAPFLELQTSEGTVFVSKRHVARITEEAR